MDPLTLGIAGIGLGVQAFGFFGARGAQKQAAQAAQNVAALEQQVNGQRRNAMELSAKRQQLEIFRNMQRARAQGTQAAVSQGAQFGTGLQGGLAQVAGSSYWNALGVTQNLEIGRNIFNLNDQISAQKALMAKSQSEAAEYQGYSALGGAITGNAKTLSGFAGYAMAPSGPITLGGPNGPTPFSPQYT